MNAMFQPKFANPAAPVAAQNQPQEKWAKVGFINLSLPDGNGGLAKLGSFGLEIKNPRHQKLAAWLTADDGAHLQERLRLVLDQCVADYRSAEKDESVSFALPGM